MTKESPQARARREAVRRAGGGEAATPEAVEPPPVPQRAVMSRYLFRAPPELWHRTQEKAYAEGETVSDVLRRAMRDYVA